MNIQKALSKIEETESDEHLWFWQKTKLLKAGYYEQRALSFFWNLDCTAHLTAAGKAAMAKATAA